MRNRILALELLRVLGLLAVVAFLLADRLPAPLRGAAGYGWFGGAPLFMVSGFVVCLSNWGRTPAEFLRNRAARLLPLLPLGLPALVLAPGAGGWLLRAQVLFCTLFTVLLWRGLTRRHAVFFGYAWLIGAVLVMPAGPGLVRTLAQPEVAGFFAGGLAFALIRRFGPDITLAGLAAVAYVLSVHFTVARAPAHAGLAALAVTALFAAVLVVAVSAPQRSRFVATPVYPLSLLAPAAGWLAAHLPGGRHPLLLTAAALLAAAALAEAAVRRLTRMRRHHAGPGPDPHRRRPQDAAGASPAAEPSPAAPR